MSGGAQFGGPIPRRLVGGQYRRLAEGWRMVGTVAPVAAVALTVVTAVTVVAFRFGQFGTITAVVAVVVVVWVGRGRVRSTVARWWWRAEWPWAARSAGLVIPCRVGHRP